MTMAVANESNDNVRGPSSDPPTVYCLHYLGGSARAWTQVAALMRHAHVVALDLPGFGSSTDVVGYSVAEMATTIAHKIGAGSPQRWLLAGHSMGAKVAAAIARRAEDGEASLAGLVGLVLVAGSPPSPEPKPDEQRSTMLAFFVGDEDANRADARRYVSQNVASPLDPAREATASDDALRMQRAAWRAWLEVGSREDWSERIGTLQTPALIIAGERDENLGRDAQETLMVPHFANVELRTLAGAKHLLPIERPHEVARAIDELAARVAPVADHRGPVRAAYDDLIASDRVGHKTREALMARREPSARSDDGTAPRALDARSFATLRAVLDRVIPQHEDAPIPLARRIDEQLQSRVGDGWRFAILPPDADAYHTALRTLDVAATQTHGREFGALDAASQDALLQRVAAGELDDPEHSGERFDARQMRAWFEDLRADAVKAYVAHPSTLARIGYSGIANGGDGIQKSGFVRVGLDEREPWEPVAQAKVAR